MVGVNYHDANYNIYKDFSWWHIKLYIPFLALSACKAQSILEPIFRYKYTVAIQILIIGLKSVLR